MKDFIICLVIHGTIVGVVFYFSARVASYFLFNAPHGSIAEWRARLKLLRLRLPQNCYSPVDTGIEIKAPLPNEHWIPLEMFIKQHRTFQKVEARLRRFRSQTPYLIFAIFLGIAMGFIVASPILAGEQPYSSKYPWLAMLVATSGTAAFVILISLPHVHWWNELKEVTDDARNGK